MDRNDASEDWTASFRLLGSVDVLLLLLLLLPSTLAGFIVAPQVDVPQQL